MSKYKKIILPLYAFAMILLIWYMMHQTISSTIIPSPIDTFQALLILLQNDLLTHLSYSMFRIFMAIGLSIIIAFPLGILTGLNHTFDLFLSPLAYALYPLPKIAFLPLFMLLFGLGDLAKILLLVSIIIFQIQLSVRDGIKQLPTELFYASTTLGLNKLQTIWYCIIPAILPNLFSSLRMTIGISISALFLSENFATTYGIGYFIMNAWIMVDYETMFAGIIALGLSGTLLFKIIDIIEYRLCKWNSIKIK